MVAELPVTAQWVTSVAFTDNQTVATYSGRPQPEHEELGLRRSTVHGSYF